MIDIEKGGELIRFMSENPVFKGSGSIVIGVLALLFAYFIKKRGTKLDYGYWVFVSLSVFIILFGTYILMFRPLWWTPPV